MNNHTKILDTYKELIYLLSMDNEGHLNKAIADLEQSQWLYEEAMRIREE